MRAITFTNLGKLGRLGNQLFQISAVIGTALKNEMMFTFPEWEFSKYIKGDLSKFGINIRPNTFYHESDFSYKKIEIKENFDGVLDIIGYFQSEKYFIDNSEYIRNFLHPNYRIYSIVNQRLEEFGLTGEFISLHVRRGDYIGQPQYYSILDMNYYKKAIDLLPKDLPILVFSEDEEWIKNNFVGDRFIFKPRTSVSFDSNENDYIDLIMMSRASHFIMANSSYSWWGSWMSRNEEKKVIIPSSWFGPEFSSKNTDDIYPKDWIKI
jgi:hypothetical protein